MDPTKDNQQPDQPQAPVEPQSQGAPQQQAAPGQSVQPTPSNDTDQEDQKEVKPFTMAAPPEPDPATAQPVVNPQVTKMSERDIQDALEEAAPATPQQTMVVGLNESEKKEQQTYVTGERPTEEKHDPAPSYTPESQVQMNNGKQKNIILPIVLVCLIIIVALGYWLYTLL